MSDTSARHEPVLLNQVILTLSPKDDEIFVDGTFGLGGYTKALLETANCVVYGIDRDPAAKFHAEKIQEIFRDRFHFFQGRFGNLEEIMHSQGIFSVDGLVLDLGVSSPQLDRAERGFSFKREGPLDMRMGLSFLTAAEVVNTYTEKDLSDIIYRYGEEKQARRIARQIVRRRVLKPFETTKELAEVVHAVLPFKGKKRDTATLTFQALRMYVNDEITELRKVLEAAERLLKPGGRLGVVTFHSLEDREVKHFLKKRSQSQARGSRYDPGQIKEENLVQPTFRVVTKKALTPEAQEVAFNPRARSARLRVAIREGGPAHV